MSDHGLRTWIQVVLNNMFQYRSGLKNVFMVTEQKKVINLGIDNIHDRDRAISVKTTRQKTLTCILGLI